MHQERHKWPEEYVGHAEITIYEETPVFYPYSSSKCPQGVADKIDTASIEYASFSQFKSEIFNVLPSASLGLRNQVIEGVYAGYHIQEQHSECLQKTEDTYECYRHTYKILNPGQLVRVCPETDFKRESIENLALVALVSLSKAQTLIAQHFSGKVLKPVKVLLQPKVEVLVHTAEGVKRFIRTDNATWSSGNQHDAKPILAFYPHSERYADRYPDRLFYLQPSVIAHEYGHHLFYNIAPLLSRPEKIKIRGKQEGKWSMQMDYEAIRPNRDPKLSLADRVRLLNGVNEAFADLFAYQAVHSEMMDGALLIGSGKRNRDLSEDLFDNRRLKTFNQFFLDHFSKRQIHRKWEKGAPSYTDIHTLGAIFANTLDRFLMLEELSRPERNARVFEWAQFLNRQLHLAGSFPDLEDLLEDIAEITFFAPGRNLLGEQCTLLEERFPVFYEYWRIKGILRGCEPHDDF